MGGQTIVVNIIPLLDDGGEIRQILGITYDITERKQGEQELAAAKDRMARDLDAMSRIHKISTRFARRGDIRTMLEEIVKTAIAITHADMGNIQLFDAKSGSLKIMAYKGFEQPFLDYWNAVHKGPGHLRHSARSRGTRDRRGCHKEPNFCGHSSDAGPVGCRRASGPVHPVIKPLRQPAGDAFHSLSNPAPT